MVTKEEVLRLLRAKICIPDGEHIFDPTIVKVSDITEGMLCVCGQTYAHWITTNGHHYLTTVWLTKQINGH